MGVPEFLRAIAIATDPNLTPWACGGLCESDADGDGVCDSIDVCVGVVDECGVCNGRERCTIAVVQTLLVEIATAMATSWTPLACAAVHAFLMWITTASAITWTIASALWMSVGLQRPRGSV